MISMGSPVKVTRKQHFGGRTNECMLREWHGELEFFLSTFNFQLSRTCLWRVRAPARTPARAPRQTARTHRSHPRPHRRGQRRRPAARLAPVRAARPPQASHAHSAARPRRAAPPALRSVEALGSGVPGGMPNRVEGIVWCASRCTGLQQIDSIAHAHGTSCTALYILCTRLSLHKPNYRDLCTTIGGGDCQSAAVTRAAWSVLTAQPQRILQALQKTVRRQDAHTT